ncbi:MAG: riboflavin biosynthesis protein RibF [Candidatus Eisenbacteria bacterium]|nr:riboflavin biosynthesis protein RibF [Candidatus Eisenbacteria bacterium]
MRIPECVVTIGVFDGVHIGHRAILSEVVSLSEKRDGRPVAVTFEPHPDRALGKPMRAARMTTPSEKSRLFAELGIEFLLVVAFDRKVAQMEADEFIDGFILTRFDMKTLVIGHDFCMGRERKGDEEYLSKLGLQRGFDVKAIPSFLFDGKPVSSTWVREAIQSGSIELARNLLGRYPTISGSVVQGHKKGRELGFPTANLDIREGIVPGDGVYTVFAEVEGRSLPAVLAIGERPTLKRKGRSVEVHIPGFSGDLYGSSIKLYIVTMLRKEKLFAGEADLKKAIEQDIKRGLEILKSGRGA